MCENGDEVLKKGFVQVLSLRPVETPDVDVMERYCPTGPTSRSEKDQSTVEKTRRPRGPRNFPFYYLSSLFQRVKNCEKSGTFVLRYLYRIGPGYQTQTHPTIFT